jgi:hypothetical protein
LGADILLKKRNRVRNSLAQRRKGLKEKNLLPNLAFLASWREQILVFKSDGRHKFTQAAKTLNYSSTEDTEKKMYNLCELCGREKKSLFAKISSCKHLISFRPKLQF